ncbi:MAG TPA: hypothetical protein VEG27_05980 [Usitatibacter sp.]|nr:hypothetical protein [Usitatibacter sp.]
MADKSRMVNALGERKLTLPAQLRAALAANDRTKFYFTLLQSARAHADRPDLPAADLSGERLRVGIEDTALDEVVRQAVREPDGRYHIPHAREIARAAVEDVGEMLEPLSEGTLLPQAQSRFEALSRRTLACVADDLEGSAVDQLTGADRAAGDSMHLLVMDAHKAINTLQGQVATERIDGAAVFDLKPADRPLVRAFMRGVNRTAPLRIDHPGLGTTATRSGERLLIQNDIGTTDAHVLVLHVEGLAATLTYTDVHLPRLLFLQALLDRYSVKWDDTITRRDPAYEGGIYHMTVGTFAAGDAPQLEDYLEWLGSRLVFLIDWNRARKRLRSFLPKAKALALLRWAADEELGHVAFLRAGGEQMIYEAMQFAGAGQLPGGRRLFEAIGEERAVEFLRFVLRTCSEGLRAGETPLFLHDAVRAELLALLRSGEQTLFDLVSDHAAFVLEIAQAIQLGLAIADPTGETFARVTARAKYWEQQADRLLNSARDAPPHSPHVEFVRGLLEVADDAADELEDAAFHLSLIGNPEALAKVRPALARIADLAVSGAQEVVKAVEAARELDRGIGTDGMHGFLEAVHRTLEVERQADAAERDAQRELLDPGVDFRSLHTASEAAGSLENATDAMLAEALALRDFVLRRMQAD